MDPRALLLAFGLLLAGVSGEWVTYEGVFDRDDGHIAYSSMLKRGLAPQDAPADVLFLHGFADCQRNHAPLFTQLADAGVRVVAFDYPGHGATTASLNSASFTSLAQIAGWVLDQVDARQGVTVRKPLYLVGWSTGGLLGVRIAQALNRELPNRDIRGFVGIAPGVAVRLLIGRFGMVTQDTLTSNPNPPHECPIHPTTPLAAPLFATKLLTNAALSCTMEYPATLPTLILVASDTEDKYVDTVKVKDWVTRNQGDGARMVGIQCPNSFHEMDNEPDPVGPYVRDAIVSFVESLVKGENFTPKYSSACHML